MLGDSHNFGRRVTRRRDRIQKPRTVFWERLFLEAASPLRRLLDARALGAGLDGDFFSFLGDLAFDEAPDRRSGSVAAVDLRPLAASAPGLLADLARILGRSLAFWSWFGVADLHWENLALGLDANDRIVFVPLDVEIVLGDFELPTETKLLPDADPEVVDVCRHAAGVRRLLPFLGKPVGASEVVTTVLEARRTFELLNGSAAEIADLLRQLPGIAEVPIRVLLRGTDQYVRAAAGEDVWPPLLEAEAVQLSRGDIPYFFRVLGRPGLRWWTDPALTREGRLPLRGDVPLPDPLLDPARGLQSEHRTTLAEEGLFAIVGAFDHAGLDGEHHAEGLDLRIGGGAIVLGLPDGTELETPRDLGEWVASVVLPCTCGEVRSVLVPRRTRCDGAQHPRS